MPLNDGPSAMWRAVASQSLDWLHRQGVPQREAVVLVPYAAVLAPARAAFAEVAEADGRGGWMPRIETPLTLAAGLAPPAAREPGTCVDEPLQDRLHAAEWLRAVPALAAIESRDPQAFAFMARQMADTAASLRAAALCLAPAHRPGHWQSLNAALQPAQGPGLLESVLLAMALQWAGESSAEATDEVFALRPRAWIVVQVAGAEPLAEGAMAASAVPALRVITDAAGDDPFEDMVRPAQLRRLVCEDAEAEAQAAAAEVIAALNAHRAPVALVALDRLLVRRTRALLERRGVDLVDETGWRLATTVAGTRVVSLLRAAHPNADADTRLAWLKGWPRADAESLRSLEARWRGSRHVPSPATGARLAELSESHLASLRGVGSASLLDWLSHLRSALSGGGEFAALLADTAGRQVLEALWLADTGPPEAAAAAAGRWRTGLAGFTTWVEAALEAAPFLPTLPQDSAHPRVVITPLARAVGRPFAHVVLPGADERNLGTATLAPGLVPRTLAQVAGMPTPEALRHRQRQAIAQLMRVGSVSVLRRRAEDGAALAPSPDLEWLWMRLSAATATVPAEQPWEPERELRGATPVPRPQPSAGAALPPTLSATRIEALRACPYRFFGRAVLGLEEAEELAEPLSKRDYGNWLHELLHTFHRRRLASGQETHADAQLLREAAEEAAVKLGLDEADLLPFRASFEVFVPDYLRWLHRREAAGWGWSEGEVEYEITPAELAPTRLKGVIDRIDRFGQAGPPGPGALTAWAVLDYKAGDEDAQKKRVREPLEDTQLCVYAALLAGSANAPPDLRAAYVALDDPEGPVEVPHEQVARSARVMLRHFGAEWARLRAGAPMPALGEPPTCDHCEVRGLCRRDQWSAGS